MAFAPTHAPTGTGHLEGSPPHWILSSGLKGDNVQGNQEVQSPMQTARDINFQVLFHCSSQSARVPVTTSRCLNGVKCELAVMLQSSLFTLACWPYLFGVRWLRLIDGRVHGVGEGGICCIIFFGHLNSWGEQCWIGFLLATRFRYVDNYTYIFFAVCGHGWPDVKCPAVVIDDEYNCHKSGWGMRLYCSN